MTEPVRPAEGPSSADGPPPTRQYEFNEGENKVIGAFADNLSLFGWFVLVAVIAFHAVLIGRWAIQGTPLYDRFRVAHALWPLMLVFCSVYFIRAAGAFRNIVETRGNHISNLMKGLGSLNEAFSWLNIVPSFMIFFITIGVILGIALAVVHWLGF